MHVFEIAIIFDLVAAESFSGRFKVRSRHIITDNLRHFKLTHLDEIYTIYLTLVLRVHCLAALKDFSLHMLRDTLDYG